MILHSVCVTWGDLPTWATSDVHAGFRLDEAAFHKCCPFLPVLPLTFELSVACVLSECQSQGKKFWRNRSLDGPSRQNAPVLFFDASSVAWSESWRALGRLFSCCDEFRTKAHSAHLFLSTRLPKRKIQIFFWLFFGSILIPSILEAFLASFSLETSNHPQQYSQIEAVPRAVGCPFWLCYAMRV